MDLAGVVAEAWASLLARRVRTSLTALGSLLGVGALIATLGFSETAAAQIGDRFDALLSTRVLVQDAARSDNTRDVFPRDAAERLRSLNGVVTAGEFVLFDEPLRLSKLAPAFNADEDQVQLSVVGASADALSAARVTVHGRMFDPAADRHELPVAMIGSAAAQKLGLAAFASPLLIYVEGQPFLLSGIITHAGTEPSLLLSVVVPRPWAERLHRSTSASLTRHWVVLTNQGAAQQVGDEVPYALRPDAPSRVSALVPPAPESLRRGIESDTRNGFLLLAALSLLVGALGIANSTLVAVIERRGEIGLRRALGASRVQIILQFLLESGLTGLLGGVVGTALAIDLVVGLSALRGWTPVLSGWQILAAPLIALGVGIVAGAYPAMRAARIEPVDALRQA